jgi:putative oxidoreductase
MANLDISRGAEPRPLIPALANFYAVSRDLAWPVVRFTAGGFLFVHGFNKVANLTIAGFAGGLARRGIEPSLALAYVIFTLETLGALCLAFGFLTRFWATAIGIEFLLITFVAHWNNGFSWTQQGGGWEFPLFWGLIVLAIGLRGGGPYSVDRMLGREL